MKKNIAVDFKGFHTTQYDLNRLNDCFIGSRTKQFPYYIVRFKLPLFCFSYISLYRFHTTQYDLNPEISEGTKTIGSGFHTTQYDLNPRTSSIDNARLQRFPYYIVRFKRNRKEKQIIYKMLFPYYIVRFKQKRNESQYEIFIRVSILHSTI